MREIPGWAGDIYPWQEEVLAKAIPQGGTYLEIGTFLGASLAHIGTLRPDISLIAVDPWLDEPSGELSVGFPQPIHRGWAGLGCYEEVCKQHGGMWFTFLHMMKTHAPDVLRRTKIIRGTAATVTLKEPVDALFVDGAHDYPNVKADLHSFAGLVKPGGIVSGHDFDGFWPGVVKAVTEKYGQPKTRETVWWVFV
jgi:hypothetical protein